jgi:hypothetical protein
MKNPTISPRRCWFIPGLQASVVRFGFAFATLACLAGPLRGQTLNPRAYWPAPNGTNIVSFGYTYSSGGFVADPSLPVEDVDAQTHGFRAGYVRVFSLGGKTARVAVAIPRVESTVEGIVEDDERARVLSGWADSSVEFSLNLKGAPAMKREEFLGWLRDPRSVLGLTIKLQAPTGAYDPERLVNLGTNRWSAKPEIGYIGLFGHWVTEVTAGIRFFDENDDFQGQVRTQDPIGSAAIHFGRPVRRKDPNFWFSAGIACAYGGRTTVGGIERNDLQQNWVAGGTLAYPLPKGQIVRLQVSTSLQTSIGADSTIALLAYSKAWVSH